MSNQAPVRSDQPELRLRKIKILGTGGAPTKVFGANCAVTRLGAGNYRITFSEYVGAELDAAPSLESTLMTDIKGYTVIYAPYDPVNRRLDFTVFNSAFAAADLAAGQWLTTTAAFRETGLTS